MQATFVAVLAIIGMVAAGGDIGYGHSNSVQHAHAVQTTVHHPVVQTVAQPIVHHAPAIAVAHPVVHHPVVHHPIVHHAPVVNVVKTVSVVQPAPLYKAVVPVHTAYASTYSYRAPAAKIVKTIVAAPTVVHAPVPIVRTVVNTPVYAQHYAYRAAPAYHVASPQFVHHRTVPVLHHAVAAPQTVLVHH